MCWFHVCFPWFPRIFCNRHVATPKKNWSFQEVRKGSQPTSPNRSCLMMWHENRNPWRSCATRSQHWIVATSHTPSCLTVSICFSNITFLQSSPLRLMNTVYEFYKSALAKSCQIHFFCRLLRIKQNCDWTGKQLNANLQNVQTIHPIQKNLKPATLQKTSIHQKQKQEKLIHLTAITYYIFQIQKG